MVRCQLYAYNILYINVLASPETFEPYPDLPCPAQSHFTLQNTMVSMSALAPASVANGGLQTKVELFHGKIYTKDQLKGGLITDPSKNHAWCWKLLNVGVLKTDLHFLTLLPMMS